MDIGEARGRTPLHYAAQRGASGCIQALLDYQADANLCDKRGATALLLLGGGYIIKGHRRVSGYYFVLNISHLYLIKGLIQLKTGILKVWKY